MSTTLIFFVVLAGAWAIGDAFSIRTKAFLSAAFTAMVLLLIATWVGWLPTDVVNLAGMGQIAPLCIPLLLVHMGTTISAKQIKSEWKTVVICLGGLVTLLIGIFTLLRLVLGNSMAIIGGSVVYGGTVVNLIIAEKTTTLGRGDLTAFNWLLGSIQIFVGLPLALFFLKFFLKGIVKKDWTVKLAETLTAGTPTDSKDNKPDKPCFLPEKYQTPFILFFFTGVIAYIAYFIGGYTNKYIWIHPYIVCLLFGFLANKLRIIPEKVLAKANAYGFATFALFIYISGSIITSVSLELFLQLIGPIVLVFVISVPFLALGAGITAKFVKIDPKLGVALVCSCMFGFPTTIIVAQEASRALGRSPEEINTFEQYLIPKMLIAGLLTVSLVSGIVASFIVNLLS